MAVLFRTRILTSVGAALGSATCGDREWVTRQGRPPGRGSLLPAPHPMLDPTQGPCLLHRWHLEARGTAQDKRAASGWPLPTSLGGPYCRPHELGSPFRPPLRAPPSPPGPVSREAPCLDPQPGSCSQVSDGSAPQGAPPGAPGAGTRERGRLRSAQVDSIAFCPRPRLRRWPSLAVR